ncbi:MAG: EpsG family protein [Bacteroidota bacterium]|nr:EpsG family protein [Bacteroidota bacterium]
MLTYNLLKFILVISTIIGGYRLQKKVVKTNGNIVYKYPFLWSVFSVLIVYTFVEGLRYARAADYFTYYNAFTGDKNVFFEPVFLLLTNILAYLNAPFYIGFLTCSFLLIFSGCLLIKEVRFAGLFAIPLFYLDTIGQSSNLVRMYLSLSFVLIALRYLIQKKTYKVIIFLVLAFFSHYSSIILFPFIYLFNKFDYPFKSRYIIMILFFISNAFPIGLEFIAENISKLQGMGIYDDYLENTDIWVLGIGIESLEIDFSVFYYIRLYLIPLFILWFGYKYIRSYKRYKFGLFYNLYVIGILLAPTALTLPTEIFYRLCLFFLSFKFIILSVIFYDLFNNFRKINIFVRTFVLFVLSDSIYLLLKTIFNYSSEFGYLFIWDRIIY